MTVSVRKVKRFPLEELAPNLLELSDPPCILDWAAVFGNCRPVELEVGFGKGSFLVDESQARPDVNFVGVEIDRGLQLYVATRLAKRSIPNVRLVRADARSFVRHYVPAGSLAAIHVYFPDPWWKKRHKKRRVFTAEFAGECQRTLQLSGRLHLATDVEEYFAAMTHMVTESPRLHRKLPETSAPPTAAVLTNFERKAKQQGRAVWRAVYEKCE